MPKKKKKPKTLVDVWFENSKPVNKVTVPLDYRGRPIRLTR
jgi:hypothetical protein